MRIGTGSLPGGPALALLVALDVDAAPVAVARVVAARVLPEAVRVLALVLAWALGRALARLGLLDELPLEPLASATTAAAAAAASAIAPAAARRRRRIARRRCSRRACSAWMSISHH
jgi:hypothetical protein